MTAPRILVTGGAGYIGSHACKALAANGFRPVAFDNLSLGHRDAVRWGPFVYGDILDTPRLAEAMRAHGISAVIHFAALAYVGESVHIPARYYRTNVGGTLSLLEACRLADVHHLVFSSSCATYGIPDRLPVSEAAEQCPINPYGRTKLMAEEMLADESHATGLHFAALRYFNAAGADPQLELGERHDPETHIVPLTIRAALGQAGPLEIYGDDYPTPDGTCVRDFVHVSDLADAHVRALDHLLSGGDNLAANLGSGTGTSILQLIRAVERQMNCSVPVHVAPRRIGDPPALYADVTRARGLLGFAPRHSDLDAIVATAVRYHANANGGYS